MTTLRAFEGTPIDFDEDLTTIYPTVNTRHAAQENVTFEAAGPFPLDLTGFSSASEALPLFVPQFILSILAIVLNSAIFLVVPRWSGTNDITKFLFRHLALMDILYPLCFIVRFISMALIDLSKTFCTSMIACSNIFGSMSALNILLMGIRGYTGIKYIRIYHRWFGVKGTKRILTVSWICIIILNVNILIRQDPESHATHFDEPCYFGNRYYGFTPMMITCVLMVLGITPVLALELLTKRAINKKLRTFAAIGLGSIQPTRANTVTGSHLNQSATNTQTFLTQSSRNTLLHQGSEKQPPIIRPSHSSSTPHEVQSSNQNELSPNRSTPVNQESDNNVNRVAPYPSSSSFNVSDNALQNTPAAGRRLRKLQTLTKISSTILVLYIISWFPYMLTILAYVTLCREEQTCPLSVPWVLSTAALLLVNPLNKFFIYYSRSDEFKFALKQTLFPDS